MNWKNRTVNNKVSFHLLVKSNVTSYPDESHMKLTNIKPMVEGLGQVFPAIERSMDDLSMAAA
jgi:hypothetical protein